MENDCVLGLFRFGPRRYVEDFLSGRLYMNTLAYFANIEAGGVRHDRREGSSFWLPGQDAILQCKVKIEEEYQTVAKLFGPISYSHPDNLRTNIFCMYALLASGARKLVERRILEFGDTVAVLLDGDEFLARVRVAAQKAGYRVECRLVEYVDKATYHGSMGPFKKASDFSYQSECRIALLPGTGYPYTLEVGDLADIAAMGPSADLRIRVE